MRQTESQIDRINRLYSDDSQRYEAWGNRVRIMPVGIDTDAPKYCEVVAALRESGELYKGIDLEKSAKAAAAEKAEYREWANA